MVNSDFIRHSAAVLGFASAVVILVPLIKRNLLGVAPVEMRAEVCRGEHERQCPDHNFFIGCGSITEWAQKRCREFSIVDASDAIGGRCGYVIASVTCKRDPP